MDAINLNGNNLLYLKVVLNKWSVKKSPVCEIPWPDYMAWGEKKEHEPTPKCPWMSVKGVLEMSKMSLLLTTARQYDDPWILCSNMTLKWEKSVENS